MTHRPSAASKGRVIPIRRSGKCPLTEAQYSERDAIVSQHIVEILKGMFQALPRAKTGTRAL